MYASQQLYKKTFRHPRHRFGRARSDGFRLTGSSLGLTSCNTSWRACTVNQRPNRPSTFYWSICVVLLKRGIGATHDWWQSEMTRLIPAGPIPRWMVAIDCGERQAPQTLGRYWIHRLRPHWSEGGGKTHLHVSVGTGNNSRKN